METPGHRDSRFLMHSNSSLQDRKWRLPFEKHKKVFQDLPMELPLERRIEHIIEVKPGSSPVKVKPYRYPHHHKTRNRKISPGFVEMWCYYKK
jgi:hypothetical protein